MNDLALLLELTQSAMTGITLTVLVYLYCHRRMYNYKDFGITAAILLSILLRYGLPSPPVTHVIGITLLNVIFLAVLAMVWSRPSKIPAIDQKNECSLISRTYQSITKIFPDAVK